VDSALSPPRLLGLLADNAEKERDARAIRSLPRVMAASLARRAMNKATVPEMSRVTREMAGDLLD
jgi:hypothetical protein